MLNFLISNDTVILYTKITLCLYETVQLSTFYHSNLRDSELECAQEFKAQVSQGILI